MSLNVFEYLEKLPPDALDKLYGKGAEEGAAAGQRAKSHGQWTCRALLQSLPQLAKQYVMRLLFVEGSVDKGMLKSWVKKEYQRVHAVSIRKVWWACFFFSGEFGVCLPRRMFSSFGLPTETPLLPSDNGP